MTDLFYMIAFCGQNKARNFTCLDTMISDLRQISLLILSEFKWNN